MVKNYIVVQEKIILLLQGEQYIDLQGFLNLSIFQSYTSRHRFFLKKI